MNSIKIIFFLIIFAIVKDETWYDEVKNYDITDVDYGYAGSAKKIMMDFYLCSERKYRVHYKEDDEKDWSKEFCCCQPAGIGKPIDGIAISGGKSYLIAVHDTIISFWMNATHGYNISQKGKGYLGDFDRYIEAIAIMGREWYRFGFNSTVKCTFEKEIAKEFIKSFFKNKYLVNDGDSCDYNKTINIINKPNIDLILLHPDEIKYNGKILIQIGESKIDDFNKWGGYIGKSFTKYLKNKKNLDYELIRYFIPFISKKVFNNANMAFNFYWKEKKIELDVALKIRFDHHSYRGGFRLIINLDENAEYFIKVKDIFKTFLKYSGNFNNNSMKKISEANNFEEFEELLGEFKANSNLAEEAILFTILEPLLNYEAINKS